MKILVIDDQEDIRKFLTVMLCKNRGWKTDTADSGEYGLRRVHECCPDVILLDYMLPDLEGRDVLKDLKADPKTAGIPVVMLTAKSDPVMMKSLLDLGAADFITKPFDIQFVVKTLKKVVKKVADVSNPRKRNVKA